MHPQNTADKLGAPVELALGRTGGPSILPGTAERLVSFRL
jgi:hypothetical protein